MNSSARHRSIDGSRAFGLAGRSERARKGQLEAGTVRSGPNPYGVPGGEAALLDTLRATRSFSKLRGVEWIGNRDGQCGGPDTGCGGQSPLQLVRCRTVRTGCVAGEGRFAANGAFVAETGKYTGRSPKDKFVVRDAWAEANVAFGAVNQPIEESVFDALMQRVADYLQGRELFVFDGAVGKAASHQLEVRVITELAWHNAFARNMLVRDPAEGAAFAHWNLIYAPGFQAVPERDGTRSEAFIIIHFGKQTILIGGTQYAGELKKSVFSV